MEGSYLESKSHRRTTAGQASCVAYHVVQSGVPASSVTFLKSAWVKSIQHRDVRRGHVGRGFIAAELTQRPHVWQRGCTVSTGTFLGKATLQLGAHKPQAWTVWVGVEPLMALPDKSLHFFAFSYSFPLASQTQPSQTKLACTLWRCKACHPLS